MGSIEAPFLEVLNESLKFPREKSRRRGRCSTNSRDWLEAWQKNKDGPLMIVQDVINHADTEVFINEYQLLDV